VQRLPVFREGLPVQVGDLRQHPRAAGGPPGPTIAATVGGHPTADRLRDTVAGACYDRDFW